MSERDGHIDEAPMQPAHPEQEAGAPRTGLPDAPEGQECGEKPARKPRRHLIRPAWLRRTLKTLLGLLIFIMLLPVIVYIPFLQDWLKDIACSVVESSTGLHVSIDRFRLHYPLDVQLDGVLVLTEKGDTMVQARSLVADVKILPLLKLDAQINRVRLLDGKYLMVSEDSSMTMRLQAGELRFEKGSALNLKASRIDLHHPVLRDADVRLDLNVWKKKPDSVASPPTQWVITADRLRLHNVRYSMAMLPTIKDLDVRIGDGTLTGALIDLRHSMLRASSLDISGGSARYVVPTAEYIAAHPAPVDTVSPPSPPFKVNVKRARLGFDKAFYGVDGAKPQPGFDPSYIEATDVFLALDDFYNCASTVRLPLTAMRAKERSGLEITSGSGTVAIDSLGLKLKDMDVVTTNSSLRGNADVSLALMALNPDAPVNVQLAGSLGWADIYVFMPSLRPMLSLLPNRDPIVFNVAAAGTLGSVDILSFKADIRQFLALTASGSITNPTDFKRMSADIILDGRVSDAGVLNRLFAKQLAAMGVRLPSFALKGHVNVTPSAYKADLSLKSSAGDASLKGSLLMTPEKYDADVSLSRFDVGAIMPSLGLGIVDGSLTATGAGFNPMRSGAVTSVDADMGTLVYAGHNLAPLQLTGSLHGSIFDVNLEGSNPNLDLSLTANGTLRGDEVNVDMDADLRHVALHELGLMKEPCGGTAQFTLSGYADISSYACDLSASLYALDWTLGENRYEWEHAFDATLRSDASSTAFTFLTEGVDLDMNAAASLKRLMGMVPKAMAVAMKQVESRQLDMEALGDALPEFAMNLNVNSRGPVAELISGSGYHFDTLSLDMQKDSLFSAKASVLAVGNGSLIMDTVTLDLNQRRKMLDYKVHIGNTAANLPEFASVNLTGYMGANRASLYLRQRNSQGAEGYRLGLTAAMMDSTINLHLTPLDAMIAYKPWSINDDNYIQLGPGNRVEADLMASGGGSSIRLSTPQRDDNKLALKAEISNLHIEDFLQMSATAPPITGQLNTDLTIVYRGNAITGSGSMGVKNLAYDDVKVGDIDFDLKAGMGFTGNTGGSLSMLYNGTEVLEARGYMMNDSTAAARRVDGTPTAFELELKKFPLAIANPFLSPEYLQLTGALNGKMRLTGSLTAPLLNGSITSDKAGISVPMAGTTVYLDEDNPITVQDNLLRFDEFDLRAANENTVKLNGVVDARNLADMSIDLSLKGNDVALVNSKNASKEIYGKLFVNLDATARGPLSRLDVDADLSLLPSTDIFYSMTTVSTAVQSGNTTDVVRFVQFADSTVVAEADSVKTSPLAMRINADLNIVNDAKATVILSTNGTDKAVIYPYGNLSYTQNYMGDMRLNGIINVPQGSVRYTVPVIGDKSFTIDNGSYVTWSGDVMNPALHLGATSHVKANVQQEGVNSRLIYFDVSLSVLGTLSAPKVTFDLSTDDDMTVQNELLSMSADQRQAAAINLLLYNTYTGAGVKASANLSNPLYSFLTGQLNSWAAKAIPGVDLSFGIDNYKQTIDGQNDNATSYSYQVSKSLFDNRFKIVVGGNYSTSAEADENFAQNLISNISFEYSLKQTQNLNMSLRLFRHTGYESILEGEVTETGVGFVMRRKLSDLKSLLRFGRRRKHAPEHNDSVQAPEAAPVPLTNDSIIHDEK